MSDSAPIAFPTSTSNETVSQKAPSMTQTPGITFAQGISTPECTGTPDPESETKHKCISFQNFQHLARRLSVTTKCAGSILGIHILGNFWRDTESITAACQLADKVFGKNSHSIMHSAMPHKAMHQVSLLYCTCCAINFLSYIQYKNYFFDQLNIPNIV